MTVRDGRCRADRLAQAPASVAFIVISAFNTFDSGHPPFALPAAS